MSLLFVDSSGHPTSQLDHLIKVFCTPNPHKIDLYDEITERSMLVQSVTKHWSLGSKDLYNQQEQMGVKDRIGELILSEPNFSESLLSRLLKPPFLTCRLNLLVQDQT